MFEAALGEITEYKRIIIHRHAYPDGDALGSQIGLKHIIKANFPEKQVYAVGDRSLRYGFMEDSEPDVIPDSFYEGALAIILDTSAKALISGAGYTLAKRTLRIDHHIFVEKIADVETVDTSFESCCGMITALAEEGGLTIPRIAAGSLYTGMVTDSGRFRYDCTSERTFRLAAKLMEMQPDIGAIYTNLYSDDFEAVRLRASFVLKIKFTTNGVAYIYTTSDEMRSLGVDAFSISRGMVGTMSDIKGVSIWVNFTETDAGVLCEIRSSDKNINPTAVKYGGGGHAKASGATLKSREEAMKLLGDLDLLSGGKNE